MLDAEFDALMANPTTPSTPDTLAPYSVSVPMRPGVHAGLTLKNVKDGPGVVVTKCASGDAAYKAGLRADDRLVWANGARLPPRSLKAL